MGKYTDEQNVLIAQKEGGADNIFNIYTNSSSDYFTVVNKYYSDIENEVLNRAEEFTKNNGLEYIQNEILKASMYINETSLLGQGFSNPGIHDFLL